jgi:hypothetical protein
MEMYMTVAGVARTLDLATPMLAAELNIKLAVCHDHEQRGFHGDSSRTVSRILSPLPTANETAARPAAVKNGHEPQGADSIRARMNLS